MPNRKRTRMIRVSDRAHHLAGVLDPEGDLGGGVEFALELAAKVTFPSSRSIGSGMFTGEAERALDAYNAKTVDFKVVRLAQALELIALASASEWPDGSRGVKGLVGWLMEEDPISADAFHKLARGDDILRHLRRVHGVESRMPSVSGEAGAASWRPEAEGDGG